jgi:hypothetical protein
MSITGEAARQKLEERIEKGRAGAERVLELMEVERPVDMVLPGAMLNFIPNGDVVDVAWQDVTRSLHKHALTQVASDGKVPGAFITELAARKNGENWGSRAAANLLNEIYQHDEDRHLVRSVGTQVRGFLSDRYRRMDAAPIVDSFIKAAGKLGAMPYSGQWNDLSFHMRAIYPKPVDIGNGEWLVFGANLRSSDFGCGSLEVSAFIERLVCLNGMVRESALRKVHLGARLQEGALYSAHTWDLDTRAMASATGDIIRGLLNPQAIEKNADLIRNANEETIDVETKIKSLVKKNLINKGEAKAITEAFTSADIEMMPPGQTTWRLSNAMSHFANSVDDAERRYELQRLSAQVIEG